MGSTLGEQLNSQGYAVSSLGAWHRDGLTLIAFSTPTALALGSRSPDVGGRPPSSRGLRKSK